MPNNKKMFRDYIKNVVPFFFGEIVAKIEGNLWLFTIAIMKSFGYNYIGRKLDFVVV